VTWDLRNRDFANVTVRFEPEILRVQFSKTGVDLRSKDALVSKSRQSDMKSSETSKQVYETHSPTHVRVTSMVGKSASVR
jgi:hypothetical protein